MKTTKDILIELSELVAVLTNNKCYRNILPPEPQSDIDYCVQFKSWTGNNKFSRHVINVISRFKLKKIVEDPEKSFLEEDAYDYAFNIWNKIINLPNYKGFSIQSNSQSRVFYDKEYNFYVSFEILVGA